MILWLYMIICQPQWPRSLGRRSAAVRVLRLWVRIPRGAWMSVCCECCVLSVRGLCNKLITRPEESYRRWCVAECDLETPWMRRPWPTGVLSRQKHKNKQYMILWKYHFCLITKETDTINPLNPELQPICYLLALLAHHFLHVSRIRVKLLTLRRLMSYIYIYGAPILDVSRSHTTTQHSR